MLKDPSTTSNNSEKIYSAEDFRELASLIAERKDNLDNEIRKREKSNFDQNEILDLKQKKDKWFEEMRTRLLAENEPKESFFNAINTSFAAQFPELASSLEGLKTKDYSQKFRDVWRSFSDQPEAEIIVENGVTIPLGKGVIITIEKTGERFFIPQGDAAKLGDVLNLGSGEALYKADEHPEVMGEFIKEVVSFTDNYSATANTQEIDLQENLIGTRLTAEYNNFRGSVYQIAGKPKIEASVETEKPSVESKGESVEQVAAETTADVESNVAEAKKVLRPSEALAAERLGDKVKATIQAIVDQAETEFKKVENSDRVRNGAAGELKDNINSILENEIAKLESSGADAKDIKSLKKKQKVWLEKVEEILASNKSKSKKIDFIKTAFKVQFPKLANLPVHAEPEIVEPEPKIVDQVPAKEADVLPNRTVEIKKLETEILSPSQVADLSDDAFADLYQKLMGSKDAPLWGFDLINLSEDLRKYKEGLVRERNLRNNKAKPNKSTGQAKTAEGNESGETERPKSGVLSVKEIDALLVEILPKEKLAALPDNEFADLYQKLLGNNEAPLWGFDLPNKELVSYKEALITEYNLRRNTGRSKLEKNLKEGKKSVDFSKASSFEELYDLIDKAGNIQGSRMEYTPQELKDLIEEVRIGMTPIHFITREFGLKDKVNELLAKEKHGVSFESIDSVGRDGSEIVESNEQEGEEFVIPEFLKRKSVGQTPSTSEKVSGEEINPVKPIDENLESASENDLTLMEQEHPNLAGARDNWYKALRERGKFFNKKRAYLGFGEKYKAEAENEFATLKMLYEEVKGDEINKKIFLWKNILEHEGNRTQEEINESIALKYIELLNAEESKVDQLAETGDRAVMEKFKGWWKKHAKARMVLGLGLMGTSLVLSGGVAAGVFIGGLAATRGLTSGAGAFMATEAILDTRTEALGQKGLIDDLKNIGFKRGKKAEITSEDKEQAIEQLQEYSVEDLGQELARLRILSLDKGKKVDEAGRFGGEQTLMVQAVREVYYQKIKENYQAGLEDQIDDVEGRAESLAQFVQREQRATHALIGEQDNERLKSAVRYSLSAVVGITAGLVVGGKSFDRLAVHDAVENTDSLTQPALGGRNVNVEEIKFKPITDASPAVHEDGFDLPTKGSMPTEVTVKSGDNIWKLVEGQLSQRVENWETLSKEQQTYFVDHFKDQVVADPDIVADPDVIKPGDKIDFGDTFNKGELTRINEHTLGLSQEELKNISVGHERITPAQESFAAEPAGIPEKTLESSDLATGELIKEKPMADASWINKEDYNNIFIRDASPEELNKAIAHVFETNNEETISRFVKDYTLLNKNFDSRAIKVFMEVLAGEDGKLGADLGGAVEGVAKISNHGQIDAVIERFNVLSHSHELPQDAWEPREVKNPITGEKFYALTKKVGHKLLTGSTYVVEQPNGEAITLKGKILKTWLNFTDSAPTEAPSAPKIADLPKAPTAIEPESLTHPKFNLPKINETKLDMAIENEPPMATEAEASETIGKIHLGTKEISIDGADFKIKFIDDNNYELTSRGVVKGTDYQQMLKKDWATIIRDNPNIKPEDMGLSEGAVTHSARSIYLEQKLLNSPDLTAVEKAVIKNNINLKMEMLEKKYGDVFK